MHLPFSITFCWSGSQMPEFHIHRHLQFLCYSSRLVLKCLINQAAFLHDFSGIWILGIVPGFNSVYFYFFKKKGNDCCKGFACKSAVPPAAAKAVSDMNFFSFSFSSITEMVPIGSPISFGIMAHW